MILRDMERGLTLEQIASTQGTTVDNATIMLWHIWGKISGTVL